MNINRYALCKERSLQKIISKQPKPNTTAIGVCSETQVTHHIITKRSDECLPISAYVPKHKEGDGKKFPVIIDIYGGDFVAGRDAVRILYNAHPELDIYALSAFMPENPAAVGEKYGWLDVYVPEIDAAHRIFVPCGESKAAAAANRLKMPFIDKSFVLLDDYSVNLHDWKEKGGSGIKLRNGINGNIGTWKGPSVSRFNTPETLATLICQAAKIRANA